MSVNGRQLLKLSPVSAGSRDDIRPRTFSPLRARYTRGEATTFAFPQDLSVRGWKFAYRWPRPRVRLRAFLTELMWTTRATKVVPWDSNPEPGAMARRPSLRWLSCEREMLPAPIEFRHMLCLAGRERALSFLRRPERRPPWLRATDSRVHGCVPRVTSNNDTLSVVL